MYILTYEMPINYNVVESITECVSRDIYKLHEYVKKKNDEIQNTVDVLIFDKDNHYPKKKLHDSYTSYYLISKVKVL